MLCPLCDDTHPSTDVDACPGECNRAWINAEKLSFDEAKKRRPDRGVINHGVPMIPAAPVWCRECQTSITTTIGKFPDLCAGLTPGDLNTGRDVQVGPRVAAIVPPTNSPAWDQADEIIRWAVNLEDDLRARIGDLGRGPRPWRTLSSAVWFLTAHATPLLCGPDAVQVGFDALRMSRRLEQVTGADRVIHRLPGACMVCDRKALQRKDGDDLVKCKACGATWYEDYYLFLVRALADQVRAG
jgi:ribosomal protein L37AE/L43A